MGFKPSPAGTEDLLLHLFGRIVQQNLPRTARPSGSKMSDVSKETFGFKLKQKTGDFAIIWIHAAKQMFCTPNMGNYTAKQKVEAASKVHLIIFNHLATWCHQTQPRNKRV
jgi:hypothetical protein